MRIKKTALSYDERPLFLSFWKVMICAVYLFCLRLYSDRERPFASAFSTAGCSGVKTGFVCLVDFTEERFLLLNLPDLNRSNAKKTAAAMKRPDERAPIQPETPNRSSSVVRRWIYLNNAPKPAHRIARLVFPLATFKRLLPSIRMLKTEIP